MTRPLMMEQCGLIESRLQAWTEAQEHSSELSKLYSELDLRVKHLHKVASSVLDQELLRAHSMPANKLAENEATTSSVTRL